MPGVYLTGKTADRCNEAWWEGVHSLAGCRWGVALDGMEQEHDGAHESWDALQPYVVAQVIGEREELHGDAALAQEVQEPCHEAVQHWLQWCEVDRDRRGEVPRPVVEPVTAVTDQLLDEREQLQSLPLDLDLLGAEDCSIQPLQSCHSRGDEALKGVHEGGVCFQQGCCCC